VRIQVCRNRRQRFSARCAGGVDMLRHGLGPCDSFGMIGGGETSTVDAEPDTTGLCGCEGGFGPLRNHLPFMLGERSQHVQHQLAGVRVVGGDELDIAFHQGADERDVAAETVQLGNDQDRFVTPACLQGERELRSVVFAAALDLDELGDDGCASAADELTDRFALRFQSQTRSALLVGGDAEVGDVAVVTRGHFCPVEHVEGGLSGKSPPPASATV